MSHPLNLLQELLLTLFLALGCAWFAIDLARKLRAPQPADEPRREPAPASAAAPTVAVVASAPVATVASAPAPVPAPVVAVTSAPAPAIATPAPVAPAASVAPAPEPLVAGVPASHLAAITAAVHHLFKGRVRLASVLAAPAHAHVDWAREGRRDIFTSHRVR